MECEYKSLYSIFVYFMQCPTWIDETIFPFNSSTSILVSFFI